MTRLLALSSALALVACAGDSPTLLKGHKRENPLTSRDICAALVDTGNDGSVEATVEYTYDAAGNVVAMQFIDAESGATLDSVTATYDDAHRMLTYADDQDADGTPDATYGWSYDEAGRLTGETWSTDPAGGYRYEYDGDGIRAIEATDGGGTLTARYEYTLDEGGRATAMRQTFPDGAGATSTYRYEEDGLKVIQEDYQGSELVQTATAVYSAEDLGLVDYVAKYAYDGQSGEYALHYTVSDDRFVRHESQRDSQGGSVVVDDEYTFGADQVLDSELYKQDADDDAYDLVQLWSYQRCQ